MICPRCSNEVVLPDDEHAPLYAWVHCPHPSCGRELVLLVGDAKRTPRLLDAEDAKEEADRAVARPENDGAVVGWAVGVIAAVCIGLPCAFVVGGFDVDDGTRRIVVLVFLGVFVAAVAAGGSIALLLAVEQKVKARRWMRTLPRTDLRLTAQPKAYRT